MKDARRPTNREETDGGCVRSRRDRHRVGRLGAGFPVSGRRVAVVDELPYGGTCALRGCDPKKVLVGAAEVADWQRRLQGRGIAGDTAIAWPDLMRFKRTFTDPVPAAREQAFAAAGIATYHGPARFLG